MRPEHEKLERAARNALLWLTVPASHRARGKDGKLLQTRESVTQELREAMAAMEQGRAAAAAGE